MRYISLAAILCVALSVVQTVLAESNGCKDEQAGHSSAKSDSCLGDPGQCGLCGHHRACRPQCTVICATKNEIKTVWEVQCEEYCNPLPGLCAEGCHECVKGECEKGCPKGNPPKCGPVRCRKILIKKELVNKVPVYKCVPCYACDKCIEKGDATEEPADERSAPAPSVKPPAPTPTPAPPKPSNTRQAAGKATASKTS